MQNWRPRRYGSLYRRFCELQLMKVLAEMPVQLWLLFLMHCLDSFGVFALSSNLTLYLNRVYGLSDRDVSIIYMLWNGAMVVLGVPTGFLIDKIGLGKAMFFGSLVSVAAKIVFATSNQLWPMMIALFVGTTLGAGLLGSAIDLAVARYTQSKYGRTLIFAILYTTMNIGAILALYGIDLSLELAPGWLGYRLLFTAGALASLPTVLIAFFYDESKHLPEVPQEISGDYKEQFEKEKRAWTDVVRGTGLRDALKVVVEKRFIQLFLFSMALTGIRALFRLMETVLVSYITRVYPTASYGSILAINPNMIIVLSLVMGTLTAYGLQEYDWIVVGTVLGSLSPLWLLLWRSASLWPVYAFLVTATVGESIWSPKVKQWIVKNSPKGKKGAYGGLLPLSQFGGGIMTGPVNILLLENYCPEQSSTLWPDDSSQANYVSQCQDLWLWVFVLLVSTPVFLLVGRRWLRQKSKPIPEETTSFDATLLE